MICVGREIGVAVRDAVALEGEAKDLEVMFVK